MSDGTNVIKTLRIKTGRKNVDITLRFHRSAATLKLISRYRARITTDATGTGICYTTRRTTRSRQSVMSRSDEAQLSMMGAQAFTRAQRSVSIVP